MPMSQLIDTLLESWDRQTRIVGHVAAAVTPEQLAFVSRDGENPIDDHLCHIHGTRLYWLSQAAPTFAEPLASLYAKEGDNWTPCNDLDQIRTSLAASAAGVREAMAVLLETPGPVGPYSHPLHFMQHMIWHEGWHASAILHALRANGAELDEAWEDAHVWDVWKA